MYKKMGLLMAALVAGSTILSGADSIKVNQKNGKFDSFTLTTGVGKSHMDVINKNWGNTNVYTQSNKKIYIIDPFFYNMRHNNENRYLTNPKLWPLIQETVDQKNKTLTLSQQIPNGPFKKVIKIKMVPGVNQLMVTSTIFNTTQQTQRLAADCQCMWFGNPSNLIVYVDGKKIDSTKNATLRRYDYLCIYRKDLKASVALIMVPSPHNSCYCNIAANKSFNIQWGRAARSRDYKAQEVRTQKYILIWGDGDVNAQAQKLADQAQKGQLDAQF